MNRAEVSRNVDGLYVIVGPDATRGRPVVEVAEAALRGGARVLQQRDKSGKLPLVCTSRERSFKVDGLLKGGPLYLRRMRG
ncbi:MAG: hypothetical protein OXD46_09485 [Chloroflexi bacterium]|nr:hypothetical protein [Chloroflexota bacterium]